MKGLNLDGYLGRIHLKRIEGQRLVGRGVGYPHGLGNFYTYFLESYRQGRKVKLNNTFSNLTDSINSG